MIALPRYKLLLYEVDNAENRQIFYIHFIHRYAEQAESIFTWFSKLSTDLLKQIYLKKRRSGDKVFISLMYRGTNVDLVYRYKRANGDFRFTINRSLNFTRFR